MPETLITFLQTNPNVGKADCFVIQLPTGAVLCATEGQWDVTFLTTTPGWSGAQTTFKAAQYGVWSRGKITSEAGTKCGANTMDLTCIPKAGTTYPGLGLGILNAALNHLFDGATVWVYTAYMAIGGYGDVSAGVETKFQGTISKVPVLSRAKVQFECADPMYLLNMKVPSRLMQSNCPWSFCDANCTLSAPDYTVNFTVIGGGTQTRIGSVEGFSQLDGYFTQGVIKCLTGANAGLSQTVKDFSGGVVTTMVPWLLPVHAGDTFAVIKGCDKTLTMCKSTIKTNGAGVDNSENNGSTPFVPAPSSSV
jgi:uncharacterized phage protein (TIGR02218 family)